MEQNSNETDLRRKAEGLQRAGSIFSWIFALLGVICGFQAVGIVSGGLAMKTVGVIGLVGVILCALGVLACQAVGALGPAFVVLDATRRSASQGASYLDRIGQMLHDEFERDDEPEVPQSRDSGPPPISSKSTT